MRGLLLLILVIVFLILPAFAQVTDPIEKTLGAYWDQGILGATVIGLVLYIIWDRKKREAISDKLREDTKEAIKDLHDRHERRLNDIIESHERITGAWQGKYDNQADKMISAYNENTRVLSTLVEVIKTKHS